MARFAAKRHPAVVSSSNQRICSSSETNNPDIHEGDIAARGEAGTDLGISQHNPSKKTRHRVPEPQRLRIMQKYARGESIVQIAKEERRNRETITKIVRSDEMQAFVRQMREEFYGLAFDAMKSLRLAIQNNDDPRIAYQLLRDTGIIPTEHERDQMARAYRDPSALSPFQRTVLGLAAIAEETSRNFGGDLPTADEMRHNLRISKIIDVMTGGRSLEISLSDSIESNLLKELAEDVLGGKRTMDDDEILAAKEKYSER